MQTVFVVDDEIGIRELLSEILHEEGFRVCLAENAQQARQLRQERTPDLVLLDIWMPDMDGISLLKEWSQANLLTMPVIMLSGHATIDTAVEATRVGAFDFLEKPVALKKLLETVQRALHTPRFSLANGLQGKPTLITQSATVTHLAHARPAEKQPPIQDEQIQEWFSLPLREARDAFERTYLEHQLRKVNYQISRLAETIEVDRTYLYRKLKSLGIELAAEA